MNPRKAKKKKLVVRFDEQARREYLTGFHKRKKQRQKKAKSEKLKRERELRNEIKKEKRSELKRKLNLYHMDEEGKCEQRRITVEGEHTGESSCKNLKETVFAGVSTVSLDYPDHVVVVNTDPDLGTSLSSLVNEDSHDTENIQAAAPSTTKKAKSSFNSRTATPVIHKR